MKIKKYEEFEAKNGDIKTYTFSKNTNGSNCPVEFYLYIDADVAITVLGYINDDKTATPKPIDLSTLEKVDGISKAGSYVMMATPYTKISLTFGGATNAIVKIVD